VRAGAGGLRFESAVVTDQPVRRGPDDVRGGLELPEPDLIYGGVMLGVDVPRERFEDGAALHVSRGRRVVDLPRQALSDERLGECTGRVVVGDLAGAGE